jgi:ABC-2 type transport system permease protein
LRIDALKPWPVRIMLAKLRPLDGAAAIKLSISVAIFAAFMYGDYALFDRVFRGIAQIEKATPFFALGLLRNVLALAFLVAVTMLFSSSMTVAIGSFFNDLDLDTLHAAPMRKSRLVLTRWTKTFLQSAVIIYIFTIPIFVAFAKHYRVGRWYYPEVLVNLALLLSIPVTLGAIAIVALVRYFPVQRVHQIVASLGILVISVAVVGFRASRPERFFRPISTDDLARVLKTIELPSMERYPGTALADLMVAHTEGRPTFPFPGRIAIPSIALFAIFMTMASRIYFRAFVRARESLAPAAIGAESLMSVTDRLIRGFDLPTRAMIGKEIRILVRDVAQWSQVFLMVALMVLYMYNMRMLPLGGDVRAAVVAYANVGMAGFIVAAICLRFAYPSVSAEGKAFWLMRTAPVSYRRLLIAKVIVYSVPLTVLSLLLTTFANILLEANRVVWIFTLCGASLLAVTLVSLGVGLGALSPNFAAENPLQVGLSLGGFGYMGASLAYIAVVMLLMARTILRYFLWKFFDVQSPVLTTVLPIVAVVTLSTAIAVIPLRLAEKRLAGLSESR